MLIVEGHTDNQGDPKKNLDLSQRRAEAVAKALAHEYELILMDIQMPEVDGYEATCRLRDSGYDRPIVALTAHAFREERERCLQAGCNGHLTKPVDRRTLLESIRHYVGRGSLQ